MAAVAEHRGSAADNEGNLFLSVLRSGAKYGQVLVRPRLRVADRRLLLCPPMAERGSGAGGGLSDTGLNPIHEVPSS